MKAIAILVLLIVWSSLLAVDILNESFSSPPNFPTGWTRSGPSTTVWSIVNTANAGGSPGELRLSWTPSAEGNYRFISPAFDSRKVHDMTLSFRHMLDDYENSSQNYTIGVQISNDLTNWTTLWSVTTTAGISPTQVTVNIGYALGMSQTTYIAFWMGGNNTDLDFWYIDNVILSHENTLGSGAWTADTYYPVGDVLVPPGHTFTIPAGTILRFDTNKTLNVQGSLRALGEWGFPVQFSSWGSGATWGGIKLFNTGNGQDSTLILYSLIERCNDGAVLVGSSDKIRVTGCAIIDCTASSLLGVMTLYDTDAIVEECVFMDNGSSSGFTLYNFLSTAIIRRNTFDGNDIATVGAMIKLESYNVDNFTNNTMIRTQDTTGFGSVLYLANCSGNLYRQMIANNLANGILAEGTPNTISITNCLIVNNYKKGLITNGNVALRSSIVWGNNDGAIQNYHSGLTVRYSCLQGGQSGISGTAIPGANYTNNTSFNPLFVNPSPTSDHTSNPSYFNWTLQNGSPCIDTGDPSHPVDPDGSVVDMGMYSRRLKPFISRAADVPNDQGRQLDLQWLRNDLDMSYSADAFYSIWREGSTRENALLLSSLEELPGALNSREQNICWWDGDRTWYYLTQVPAFNFSDYGLIIPTLQDSSSTGTHAANYKVIYSNPQSYWQSVPKSGYSVDNIPPLPAHRLTLQASGNTQYLLSWDEVTEGGWEGNSYPEVNQIMYKVYASEDPAVPLLPQNLIGIAATPQMLINSASGRKFFKVLAFDTQ